MSTDRQAPAVSDCCPGSSILNNEVRDLDFWEHDADEFEARLIASILLPRIKPEATQGILYNQQEVRDSDDDNTEEKMLSDVAIPLDGVR